MLDHLFPKKEKPASTEAENKDDVGDCEDNGCDPVTSSTSRSEDRLRMPKELAEIESMESLYMKSSISALRALKEIRSGSSTVSVFSLPPLQISGLVVEFW